MSFLHRLRSAINLIKSDLYRYYGRTDLRSFFKAYYLIPGFNYSVWFRLGNELRLKLLTIILRHKKYKFGIDIPYARIGKGLLIGHFGGIVIHHDVVIGNNCNISHSVTLGISNRGSKKGVPTIGDCVYIGPGAKIFGKLRIGNNAAIGANAVITMDVPDNAVVVGVPGRIISYDGSSGYINNMVE